MIAVAAAAAVLLVASVPFAAQRVQAARRQEQQKTQSTANVPRQAFGQPESERVKPASVRSGQERGLSSSEAMRQSDTVTALGSETGGAAGDNDKATSSESKIADNDDSMREAIDVAEAQAASNTASAQPPDVEPGPEVASTPQQLPTGSDDTADCADKTDNKPKDGFFRDVSADCMQRQHLRCWERRRTQKGFMPRSCAQRVCLRQSSVTAVAGKMPLRVAL